MKHLVIGNTSQLAHYFPKDKCEFISSRNIDVNTITSKKWDKIFKLGKDVKCIKLS